MNEVLSGSRWLRGLVLTVVILAACAQPAPPEPSPTVQPAQPTSDARTTPAPQPTTAPAATAPSATTGPAATTVAPTAQPTEVVPQVIRIPITEPPQMDPGKTSDSVSVQLIMHLFDGLVAQDADGNIQPRIAESWEVSDDGLVYTFHLRDGPTWSDGKPVTAGDFEWAWKRNIDPATASDYATSLFPIKNAEKIFVEQSLDPEQLGVEATDEKTLVVTLEQPAAYFLTLASTWTLMPLRQDTVEQNGDQWVEAANILTNGPYLLKEWTHSQQIVLERNENYWGPEPQIQRAIFTIFPEGGEDQALQAYEAGELDTLGTSISIPSSHIERVKADPELGYMTFDYSATYFITVNHRQPHLQDPRVRKAMGMALERRRLIDDVLKFTATPAYTLQPPGIIGRHPEWGPQEDIEEARELLADAGFPDGKGMPELNYVYNTQSGHKLIAEYMQQQWKDALGINLKLTNLEFNVFLQFRSSEDWTEGGDLLRGGWFSDYEDPNNWYNVLWQSSSHPGHMNAGWENEEYDRIVEAAAGERDPAKRAELYSQAERILADQYPHIPLFHYGGQTLVRPYVKGMQPSRILQIVPLETMTILPH